MPSVLFSGGFLFTKSIVGFAMYILGFVIPFYKFDDKIKVKTKFWRKPK